MNCKLWPARFIIATMTLVAALDTSSAALNIFGNAPRIELQGPGNSFELGTVFESSVAGQVIGLRFYVGAHEASNPGGSIMGNLWASDGTLLASAAFSNPTEGWNEVALISPVSITANTQFVASASNNLTSLGTNYSTNEYAFFATSSYTNGPLTALAGTASSPSGTFPTGIFPNRGGGSFYGRDVTFEPAQNGSVPEPASLVLWSAIGLATTLMARFRRLGRAA